MTRGRLRSAVAMVAIAVAAGVFAAGASWAGTPASVKTIPVGIVGGVRATLGSLNGVSCSTASACTAVGFVFRAQRRRALAERWDGQSWKLQTTAQPAGARSSVLVGVSCASKRACMAVGRYTNAAGSTQAMAESWDGTRWTVRDAYGRSLSGVSCSSRTDCLAVGHLVSETWNGSAWTVRSFAQSRASGQAGINAVSCAAPTACVAVGSAGYPPSALTQTWNGTGWTFQHPPADPSGGYGFASVSCSSATTCEAVGAATPLGDLALAAWDGKSWTLQPFQTAPSDDSESHLDLSGVSCSSPTACTAVGYAGGDHGSFQSLIATWNGTVWTVTTPAPGDYKALNAVSCTSATACVFVGYVDYGMSTRPVIERGS